MYKILKLNNIAKEGIESFHEDTYIVEENILDLNTLNKLLNPESMTKPNQ